MSNNNTAHNLKLLNKHDKSKESSELSPRELSELMKKNNISEAKITKKGYKVKKIKDDKVTVSEKDSIGSGSKKTSTEFPYKPSEEEMEKDIIPNLRADNYTQQQIADATGWSQSKISRIENKTK